MDRLEEDEEVVIEEGPGYRRAVIIDEGTGYRNTYTKEYWDSTKENREEDRIAYNELKAEGFDFFAQGSFVLEDELKAIQEKSQSLMEKDDFFEIALCSTKEGFEYLQKQILAKAKGKRVINGQGNGKSIGFMRVRG